MKLLNPQQIFTLNIAKLVLFAYNKDYELTFGESYNDDGIGHAKNSCHYIRLAQDFCLFKGGTYLTKTEDYKDLGTFWKTLHPLNRWGGDFVHVPRDGNHFSMEFEGRQ